jgi:hypothetical protein
MNNRISWSSSNPVSRTGSQSKIEFRRRGTYSAGPPIYPPETVSAHKPLRDERGHARSRWRNVKPCNHLPAWARRNPFNPSLGLPGDLEERPFLFNLPQSAPPIAGTWIGSNRRPFQGLREIGCIRIRSGRISLLTGSANAGFGHGPYRQGCLSPARIRRTARSQLLLCTSNRRWTVIHARQARDGEESTRLRIRAIAFTLIL